jgi:mitochondrial import receptor subunit TOM70
VTQFGKAIEEYQKSIRLDPSFIFSHIQLAVSYYKEGQIGRALDDFKTLLKSFESSSEV